MAVLYATMEKVKEYSELVPVLELPDLNKVSTVPARGPFSHGQIYLYHVTEATTHEYWRHDGKQWKNLRSRNFPNRKVDKKDYKALWTRHEFQLMNAGKAVDLYRHEYVTYGSTIYPSRNGWGRPYCLVHYRGNFDWSMAQAAPHGNRVPQHATAASRQQQDFQTIVTPTKRLIPFRSTDACTPVKGQQSLRIVPASIDGTDSGDSDFEPTKRHSVAPGASPPRKRGKQQVCSDSSEPEVLYDDENVQQDSSEARQTSENVAPGHVQTSKAVLIKLREDAAAGLAPSISYKRTLLSTSQADGGDIQGCTPRNPKQAANIAYKERQKKQAQDDLFAVYLFSKLLPEHVHWYLLHPGLSIILGHPETIRHVQSMYKALDVVLYNYDTTYGAGPFWVSILSIRHTLIDKTPVIPVLTLLHEYTDTSTHAMFFQIAKSKGVLPDLNTAKTCIVTDREGSITSALDQELPLSHRFLCWFHIQKNVSEWVREKYGVTFALANEYKKDVNKLMKSKTLEEYGQTLAAKQVEWDEAMMKYFMEHLHTDISSTGRWMLEPLNLYNKNSGITNNASESVNATLKKTLSGEKRDFAAVMNGIYFVQNVHLLDIKRAMEGVDGNWHMVVNNNTRQKLGKLFLPSKPQDIVDLNAIDSMVSDGTVPVDYNTVKDREIPPNLKTEEGLAEFIIMKDRWEYVKNMRVFVVKGLGDRKYQVDLSNDSCSCPAVGFCSHLIAVLKLTNIYDRYKGGARKRKGGLGALFRQNLPKKIGKKGPGRMRLGTEQQNLGLDADPGGVPVGEAEANELCHQLQRVAVEDVAVTDGAGTVDETAETPTAPVPKPRKTIRVASKLPPLDYGDELLLTYIPEVTDDNVGNVILKGPSNFRVTMADLKSLQVELPEREIAVLDKYTERTEHQEFTNGEVGYISYDVMHTFFASICDDKTNAFIRLSETWALMGTLVNDGDVDDTSKLFEEDSSSACRYDWSLVKNMYCLGHTGINHWFMLAVSLERCTISVFDPKNNLRLPKQQQNRINSILNSYIQGGKQWKYSYPRKVRQHEDQNCGAYVCYYLECLIKERDLAKEFDVELYRSHILRTIIGQCPILSENEDTDTCRKCNSMVPKDVLERSTTSSPTESDEWIQCDRCDAWYHMKCVSVNPDDATLPSYKFYCE